MRIAKASAEQRRLEALLARQERHIRQAFAAFLAETRDDRVIREIAKLIAAGQVEEALRIVDTYVIRLGTIIPQVFQETARAEMGAMQGAYGGPRVALSFDPGNPRAATAMRQNQLEFIRGFSNQQRETTRLALFQAQQAGSGPREAARAFRASIGLTPSQWGAVTNYRRLLEEGSLEALQRDLRDRRFDASVRRAASSGEPLAREQIDRMVDAYHRRSLIARSETIARTEMLRTASAARDEAFRQTLEQAEIDPGEAVKTWRSTGDHRTRHSHRALNGQSVGIDEAFRSPSGASLRFPGDPMAPASEIVNCRCTLAYEVRQAEMQEAA